MFMSFKALMNVSGFLFSLLILSILIAEPIVALSFICLTIVFIGLTASINGSMKQGFHPWSYGVFGLFIKLCLPLLMINSIADLEVSNSDLVITSGYLIACIFALYLGFVSSSAKAIAFQVPGVYFRAVGARPLLWRCVLLYICSAAIFIYASANGVNHIPNAEVYSNPYMSLIRDLIVFKTLAGIVLWASLLTSYKNDKSKKMLFMALMLVLVECILGLLEGGRSKIVEPILIFLFVFSSVVRPISFVTLIQMASFGLIVVGPVITIYKEAVFKNVLETGAIDFELVATSILDMDFSKSNFLYFLGAVLSHFTGMLDGLVRTLQRVPDLVDYHLGSTFIQMMTVGWIPRILWEDKPIFLPGRYFASVIFEHNSDPGEAGVSLGIGVFAESFLNFGVFGVLVLFVFGYVLRVFYERNRLYNKIETLSATMIRNFFLVFTIASGAQLTIGGFVVGGVRIWISYLVFLVLALWTVPRIRRFVR
jgi:hypothetical protein